MTRERLLHALLWLMIILPALWQIYELAWTMYQRFGYNYDLEWMEGGMLHHALRIRSGVGIYVPPSIDFIPYLYTPLYPALLAMLGKVFGLSYALGRAISIVAWNCSARSRTRRCTSRCSTRSWSPTSRTMARAGSWRPTVPTAVRSRARNPSSLTTIS